jgi:hypothetical protein
VSDDEKPRDTATDLPVMTQAPAIHGDTLWDGPRWITNAQNEPVWIETKAEYWALLNRLGKGMKNSLESTTGPEQPKVPEPLPLSLQPTPQPDPLTKEEARIMASMSAVFRRYGLREAMFCRRCFTRNRDDGCAQIIMDREVSIRCRCGKAAYHPPVGTTDLVINHLTNTPVREMETTQASIVTGSVAQAVKAVILNKTEATILRAYAKMLKTRELEPRWFHRACWDGVGLGEDDSVGIKITDLQIAILCKCRLLFEGASDGQTIH